MAVVVLALSAGPGCASYQSSTEGYQGSGEMIASDEEPIQGAPTTRTPPTITMRGERQVVGGQTVTLNFDWPVDEARLSRGFLLGLKRPHWGLDLAAKRGTPILASEAGIVIYTGKGFRGYGNLIVIEHGEDWATLYAHLDKISVEEGAHVERGQKIGAMGRTGRASGVHLHFEIRNNRQPVNPLAYLPQGF
jgi:murein DD-endopeptidase MepM/ murein hydrolase activator NlpD